MHIFIREHRLARFGVELPSDFSSSPKQPERDRESDLQSAGDTGRHRREKADLSKLSEDEQREREAATATLEAGLEHIYEPKQSLGYITDAAMDTMEQWGLLLPPMNGVGTIESWIRDYGFDTTDLVERNFEVSGEDLIVELVKKDGSTERFRVQRDGKVQLIEKYRAIRLDSILRQRFRDGSEWIGELRIADNSNELISLLKAVEARGLVLADVVKRGEHAIGIKKDGEVLATVTRTYEEGWEERLHKALQDSLEEIR